MSSAMDIHGMHKYIYYGRQFFSLVVLMLSVVMVFQCRYTGFFQWTSRKQSEPDAADAAIRSVQAGTYALCFKTDHDFCYPIAAFLLMDIMSTLFLLLSLISFAVTVCLGQRSLESRFSKLSLLAQTFGFWAAVLSSLFAFVMYIVSKVHLQDGQLDVGFSVEGGFASIALSSAALAAPLVYELFGNNPFNDRFALDTVPASQSSVEDSYEPNDLPPRNPHLSPMRPAGGSKPEVRAHNSKRVRFPSP